MSNKSKVFAMFGDQPDKYQLKSLRFLIIAHILELVHHLANDDFDKANDMLAFSYAGDGYGDDNAYLSFGFLDIPGVKDIRDVICKLKQLHEKEME